LHLLAALSTAPVVAAAEGRSPMPIILISVDTLRADHLSCYGYKGPATVKIDRIATGGTTFLQVNSQVPLTLPSHVSLLTSAYPFANGIEDNGERLAPNAVTLARVLKSHGYRTAAFVGGFVLDRRFGLDQGFDVYDGPSNLHQQPGKDPGEIKRFGESVTRAATQWLDGNADHPFFMFVHLYDLHTPYELPPSERGRGLGYDAELGYMDKVLGKFWDDLEQRGLLRRALVVFTSDHGESLHDHGESTHGYFVYQSTLRVPLILHWPSKLSSFATRIEEPVSLLDVAPTLLQIVGVEAQSNFKGAIC
jgi:choline-sulfatase